MFWTQSINGLRVNRGYDHLDADILRFYSDTFYQQAQELLTVFYGKFSEP